MKLERGVRYRAFYWSPIDGSRHDVGEATPGRKDEWHPPPPPSFHDFVLVLDARK